MNCSRIKQNLINLPPKLGGLEILVFSESKEREYEFSTLPSNELKDEDRNNRNERTPSSRRASEDIAQFQLKITLSKSLESREQGASSWLKTIPHTRGIWYDQESNLNKVWLDTHKIAI